MKKLGYIKIEDVMELVKLVHRVHMETEYYASIEFSNFGHDVVVTAKEGGFMETKYSLFKDLEIYNPRNPKYEAEKFLEIRNYLKELLGETDG